MSKANRIAVSVSMALAVLASTLAIVVLAAQAYGSLEPNAALVCNHPYDAVAVVRAKPRRCMVLAPEASFSEGVNLARLRWTNWGSGHATFRGIDKGFHLPYLHLRVKGYAYRARPDRCGGGLMLYTRVRYRVDGRSYTVKPQDCFGPESY